MSDERESLQGQIKMLQVVYLVLFLGSVGTAVVNFVVLDVPTRALQIVFWVGLVASVAVRMYRTSLVNKHNALVLGKDGPIA